MLECLIYLFYKKLYCTAKFIQIEYDTKLNDYSSSESMYLHTSIGFSAY